MELEISFDIISNYYKCLIFLFVDILFFDYKILLRNECQKDNFLCDIDLYKFKIFKN
jgi:hypothetical protein